MRRNLLPMERLGVCVGCNFGIQEMGGFFFFWWIWGPGAWCLLCKKGTSAQAMVAEWWYNTTYHSATKLSPYEVFMVNLLPTQVLYVVGSSTVAAIDQIKSEDQDSMIKY